VSQTDRNTPRVDKLASRRSAASPDPAPAQDLTSREITVARLLAEATADRLLAAADRRTAAEYLLNAYRDDLTGALNRRPGRDQLQAEIARAHRTGTRLAVMFVDVDGLKHVNDTIGHDAGDDLLAATGEVLRTCLRGYDIVVRYGGDEFVCALPGGTVAIAEKCSTRALRALVKLVPGASFSMGYAQLEEEESLEQVIHRADADLYQRRASRLRRNSDSDATVVQIARPSR
jgi:diguanylate cyclase (GGDEF)-like protein